MSPQHDHPQRLTVRRYWTDHGGRLRQKTVRNLRGTALLLGDRPTAQRVAEILTGRLGVAHFVEEVRP